MMMIKRTFAMALAFTLVLAMLPLHALASTAVANAASSRAERGFNRCGSQFAGQSAKLNNCISRELRKMSKKMEFSDIDKVAPRAIPAVRAAASGMRRAKTKRAAIAVLNRARSVLRGLAAKNSGDARKVYNRTQRAFAVALAVVKAKG